MKKRSRGQPKARRPRDCSAHNSTTDQSDQQKRWWPDLSLEELTENRLRSTDEVVLAAEYAVAQQYPGAMFGV